MHRSWRLLIGRSRRRRGVACRSVRLSPFKVKSASTYASSDDLRSGVCRAWSPVVSGWWFCGVASGPPAAEQVRGRAD